MKIIPFLPHLQALLNLTTVCLTCAAYYHIRHNNPAAHRRFMLAAVSVSAVFMISYLTYHGAVGNVKFAGEGVIRPVYFGILISHVVLAAIIVPLVLTTLTLGLRNRFQSHRRIARWTFPIWIYVSLSGVLVYLLAFHIYPSAAGSA